MKSWIKRQTNTLIPLFVLIVLVILQIRFPQFLEAPELKAFDMLQKHNPRSYEDSPVKIINIDDESLEKLGQWPWPRTLIAELVDRLGKAQVKAIALDIVFAEPDRTSPNVIIPQWSKNTKLTGLDALKSQLPDHDKILSETFKRNPVVTAFSFTQETNNAEPAKKAGISYAGDDPKNFLPQFNGAVTNLSTLEAASPGNGSFNVFSESDGVIRRVPLLFRKGNDLYPSLIAETLRVSEKASNFIVKASNASGEAAFGEHTGITAIKIGRKIIPTDGSGQVWLYDTGFIEERFIPAWKVLSDNFDSSQLKDTIVLVGTNAAGLKDIRSTPLNPVAAGVTVHAQILEQILTENLLMRPDWAEGAEFIWWILLSLTLIILLPRVGALWCAAIGIASIVGAFAFSWYAFTKWHFLINPLVPSLANLVIYFVASLLNYLRAESERRQIRSAFTHYMSSDLVDQLAEHPEKLRLGGETKNMTLLFADIRNFTQISEQLSAEELTHLINSILTPMTEIILEEKGTIDKYMGDCIMAFWNAPIDDAKHAEHACRAALRMQAYLKKWNAQRRADWESNPKQNFHKIQFGFGINTGDCCVGNMGSSQRFDYSVIGDHVNLASRLEGATKQLEIDILLGPNTVAQLSTFATLELDYIQVKGKSEPVQVFGLFGDENVKNNPTFQQISTMQSEALEAFRAKAWDKATDLIVLLRQVQSSNVDVSTWCDLYTQRINELRDVPPGKKRAE